MQSPRPTGPTPCQRLMGLALGILFSIVMIGHGLGPVWGRAQLSPPATQTAPQRPVSLWVQPSDPVDLRIFDILRP